MEARWSLTEASQLISTEFTAPRGLRPTPLQRTMFHLCVERPGAGLFQSQRVWRAPGRVELEHARQAWACVAAHHEALRAYFRLGKGREPYVFFADDLVIPATQVALIENKMELKSFLAADRARGFNFEDPPLWRMTLLRNDTSDIVVWTCHHILLDGDSFATVFQDWRLALSAIAATKVPQLTPVRPPSFADHLAALEEADTTAARTLWRQQLSGFTGGTPLPPWPIGRRASMSQAFEEMEIEDAELLSARAKLHGATLNAVIQGAWALTLARYNATEDITFGTTRVGRYMLGHRATATGMFITTVPFRVDATASQSVGPWLKRLAQKQIALRAGEFASPAKIRAWADLPAELPLFHTVLVFTRNHPEEVLSASRELQVEKAEGVTLAVDAGRHLRLQLEYPSDKYSAAQIRAVLAHTRTLILALARAASNQTLATIAAKTSDELDGPADSLTPAVPFPRERSVVDFFRLASRQRPDAPAIRHGAQEMSYGELDQRSDQIAALLLNSGVLLEEPVALVLDRSIEFAVAALGVLKAGGSYLPVDPNAPPRRLRQLLAQSGARWALTTAELSRKVAEYTGKTIEVDTVLAELVANQIGAAELCRSVVSNPDRRAYLISTSGSTGAPKMVEIEHHSLTNLVCHYQRYLNLTTNDRISWLSPPAFDASVADLWPGLCSGAIVVIPEKQFATNPDGLIAWIAEEAITVAFVSTSLAELLLRRSWPHQLALRFFGTGGDVLHVHPSSDLPFVVINAYGPTENTVDAVWGVVHPGPSSNRPPIGRPITNVTAHVLDQQRRLLPRGEVGELYLGGEQVARGYLNEPKLTRESFIQNPFLAGAGRLYRTGDLVRWNECGELEFLGRVDLQVQIGGCRVELEEVECTLSRHPDVIEACCTPIKDGAVARSLVAHIATPKASAELEGHLRDFLCAELPAYMIPSKFIFHTSLPHTYADKVDRAALSARTPRPPRPQQLPSVRPFDNELRTLWRDLLPAAGNGTDKTFWESGGDSLKLIQLSLGVEDIMGRQLSLPAFLTDPTLRGLKNALEDAVVAWSEQPQRTSATKISKRDRRSAVIPLREASGELPLYFIGPEPAIVHFAETMDTGSSIFVVETPLPVSRHAIASRNNTTLPSIEQLASPFVTALSAHAQNAPFALAGHSTMGIVAFEVAHQLQRLGARVELIILLDTWLKRPSKLYVYWEKLLDCWKQRPGGAQEERPMKLIGLRLRDTLLIFWSMLAKGTKKIFLMFNPDLGTVTTVLDEQGVPLEYGLIDRVYANAENAYHARILDCPGKLFVASSDDERVEREYDEFFGWRNLFSKGLEIVSVPGDHLSMIREKSCSLILANRMGDALRKFEAS
jgi:amino acid adenylation domain-containing protein